MSIDSFLFIHLSPSGNPWSDVLGQQVVSQAPQHFRFSETKATCDGYFAYRSVCSVMTPACPRQHVHRVFEDGCQTLIHAILGFPHAILSLGFPHAILGFPHTIMGFPHDILGFPFPCSLCCNSLILWRTENSTKVIVKAKWKSTESTTQAAKTDDDNNTKSTVTALENGVNLWLTGTTLAQLKAWCYCTENKYCS